MKKWKCTVCGYIHEGDEPPEECPVCGADKSKFIELPSDEPAAGSDPQERAAADAGIGRTVSIPLLRGSRLYEIMMKHHIHPVSVHVPNGVLPVAMVFVVLAALFNFAGLSQAALYNLVFVVVSIPVVLFSGLIEWQNKYGGSLTKLFITKIIASIVVTLTAVILALWLFVEPDVVTTPSPGRLVFFIVNLVMLGGVTTAGLIGGKLVFKD